VERLHATVFVQVLNRIGLNYKNVKPVIATRE
jgi:hypothetical protein